MSRTSSAIVVGAAVLVAQGAWGATVQAQPQPEAPAVVTEQPGDPIQYSATTEAAARATLSAADALRSALDRQPSKSAVVTAQLVKRVDDPSAPLLLRLDLNAPSWERGEQLRAFWEGSLLQGAVAEDLATGQDTSTGIAGGTFVVHAPNGSTKELDAGAGKVQVGQVFRLLDATGQAQATADIRASVERYGLKISSVQFVRYRDDAVAVVADIPPGGSFHELEALRQALTGNPAWYEGVYLEVRDETGAPIAISATAFRTGAGMMWVDPARSGSLGEVQRTLAAG